MGNGIVALSLILSILFFAGSAYTFFIIEWGWTILFFILAFISGIPYYNYKRNQELEKERITESNSNSSSTRSPITGNPTSNFSLSENDLQSQFSKYSWREMEELVGELFRKKGYSVKVTPPTGDFGIDVEAKTDREYLGIQVKHWTYDVGVDDVIKTLGASLNFNRVILVSTKSFFTQAAWTFANKDANRYRIELWDTNRFRKELRDNMINLSKTRESGGFVSDTDSFDYDKGFKLDEVYDSSDKETLYVKKCTKCGNIVAGQYCVLCGKQVS